eukprot:16345784-Heterocapsa_arctica.AAC.1
MRKKDVTLVITILLRLTPASRTRSGHETTEDASHSASNHNGRRNGHGCGKKVVRAIGVQDSWTSFHRPKAKGRVERTTT